MTHRSEANCALRTLKTATAQIASDRTTACQLGLVLMKVCTVIKMQEGIAPDQIHVSCPRGVSQGIPIISSQWGWMVDAYMAWSSAYGSLAVSVERQQTTDSSASAL